MISDVEYNPALYKKFMRRYAILGATCFVLSAVVMVALDALLNPPDPRPIYFVGVAILFLPFPLMGVYGFKNGYTIDHKWCYVCYSRKAKFWNTVSFVVYVGTLIFSIVLFIQKGPNV